MKFSRIRKDAGYYVISDCEIHFMGTKKECCDYISRYQKAAWFKLFRVSDAWEVR